jgi:hypothetical protein
MARSGLGDGTAGKSTTPVMVLDPMAIKTPAKQAAQKTTSNMQAQASGSSSAKTMTTSKGSGSGSVADAKDAMLPRQEKDDVAGAVNGVSANIDGYKRINKRRYVARGSSPTLFTGR